MLQKRKLITAEVEYGPQREDARISLAQKGAQESLAQTAPWVWPLQDRPDPSFPSQERPAEGVRGSGEHLWVPRVPSSSYSTLMPLLCCLNAFVKPSQQLVIPWCLPLSFLCCPPSLCSQVTVTVSGGDQVGRGRGLSQGWGLRPVGNLEISNITSF